MKSFTSIRLCLLFAFVILFTSAQSVDKQNLKGLTFCNPLNLDYRFHTSGSSYREAADPMVVLYKDNYYIFASHSGGYWYSPDFANWTFVTPTGIDIEKYAPSVWVMGNTMYYTSSEGGAIYKTGDPQKGVWEYISQPHVWQDPWVFADTDGKVYCYHNCSENGTIDCVQLDPNNKFAVIGEEIKCFTSKPEVNGFEVNGDNNEKGLPWTEGSAMFKHNGLYYLTYATPGTERRSYCDGYYVSKSPTGPFTFGKNSPATHRTLGFVTGIGHGGLFYDKAGNIWTIDCVNLSVKHMFQRRLAIFPMEIDKDGYLHAATTFGDYPQYLPGVKKNPALDNLAGWNLLSRAKKTTASSTEGTNLTSNAVDEDMRTNWSATSGQTGEWFTIDLGETGTINAIQPNFYESGTNYTGGRKTAFTTRYIIEHSNDGIKWTLTYDNSTSTKDEPHDYIELDKPIKARFIRITNKGEVPGGGKFSLCDFRIFGMGNGKAPNAVTTATVKRLEDQRYADVSWTKIKGADGYNIMYGIAPDKLYNQYQVMDATSFPIRSLVVGLPYYFRVDAYNANGVTKGTQVIKQ